MKTNTYKKNSKVDADILKKNNMGYAFKLLELNLKENFLIEYAEKTFEETFLFYIIYG